MSHLSRGGGGRPLTFKNILGCGWGWWPGHEPTTWGWFWVHARNTDRVRPRREKRGHKPKATRKELEKWPSYADPNLGQKWRAGLFSANNWPYILRYGLQICFTHIYINIKEHPQPMAQNRVLESERAGPPLKCNWCNHSYLKSMLFCSGFKEGAWYIYS